MSGQNSILDLPSLEFVFDTSIMKLGLSNSLLKQKSAHPNSCSTYLLSHLKQHTFPNHHNKINFISQP